MIALESCSVSKGDEGHACSVAKARKASRHEPVIG